MKELINRIKTFLGLALLLLFSFVAIFWPGLHDAMNEGLLEKIKEIRG